MTSTQAAMSITSFGSCQAVRKLAGLLEAIARVEVTPEWLAENHIQQKALEADCAAWYELHKPKAT